MKTPVKLEVVLKALPEIVKAAVNAKNKERLKALLEKSGEMYTETEEFIEELMNDAGACAHLILEMIHDPLQAAGIDFDLPITRDVNKYELRQFVQAEIDKAVKIIPYSPPPDKE